MTGGHAGSRRATFPALYGEGINSYLRSNTENASNRLLPMHFFHTTLNFQGFMQGNKDTGGKRICVMQLGLGISIFIDALIAQCVFGGGWLQLTSGCHLRLIRPLNVATPTCLRTLTKQFLQFFAINLTLANLDHCHNDCDIELLLFEKSCYLARQFNVKQCFTNIQCVKTF